MISDYSTHKQLKELAKEFKLDNDIIFHRNNCDDFCKNCEICAKMCGDVYEDHTKTLEEVEVDKMVSR